MLNTKKRKRNETTQTEAESFEISSNLVLQLEHG